MTGQATLVGSPTFTVARGQTIVPSFCIIRYGTLCPANVSWNKTDVVRVQAYNYT